VRHAGIRFAAARGHDARRSRRLPGRRPCADEDDPRRARRLRDGPPSSGGSTVGEALNIRAAIERRIGKPLRALPRELALHYYLGASRYAYADRGEYLGDPEYVSVPLAGLLDRSDDRPAR
jgi:gamma-glutamyltranspeptidase